MPTTTTTKAIWTTEANELAGPSTHKYKYKYKKRMENHESIRFHEYIRITWFSARAIQM